MCTLPTQPPVPRSIADTIERHGRMLTVKELAQLLAESPKTAYARVKRGSQPATLIGGMKSIPCPFCDDSRYVDLPSARKDDRHHDHPRGEVPVLNLSALLVGVGRPCPRSQALSRCRCNRVDPALLRSRPVHRPATGHHQHHLHLHRLQLLPGRSAGDRQDIRAHGPLPLCPPGCRSSRQGGDPATVRMADQHFCAPLMSTSPRRHGTASLTAWYGAPIS
jgi:hypothetical protein